MRRIFPSIFGLFLLLSAATAMPQVAPVTRTVPSQTWSAGAHTYGPFNRPAGKFLLVSIQMAGPTDWQTGAVGRVIVVVIQKSTDGGVNWRDDVSNAPDGQVSPNMGHAGALPTLLEDDISDDASTVQYRIIATYSAPVICGWNVILSAP
jgi:hypothetical protein